MEDGSRHFDRVKKELIKTYKNISEGRLRIWLMKTLMSENLATREIYTFIKNQSELRSIIKSLDRKTMMSAMKMKLKDMKLVLSKNIFKKKFQESKMKEKYGLNALKTCEKENKYITVNERKKRKKYWKKIDHYRHCQRDHRDGGKNITKTPEPTTVPRHLSEFGGLSVFGLQCRIPKPVPPIGPCCCDKKIKLSKDELAVLNKDPKFSVCKPISKTAFSTEVERMLSKHRYRKNVEKKKERKSVFKLSEKIDPPPIPQYMEKGPVMA